MQLLPQSLTFNQEAWERTDIGPAPKAGDAVRPLFLRANLPSDLRTLSGVMIAIRFAPMLLSLRRKWRRSRLCRSTALLGARRGC